MAEKQQTSTPEVTSSDIRIKQKPPKHQIKSVPLLNIIAIVIATAAFIESAYVTARLNTMTKVDAKTLSQLSTTADTQSEQLSLLSNQITEIKAAIAKNTENIADNQTAVHAIQDMKGAHSKRWMLREFHYLLTMADYNLRLVQSPETALLILENINEQLTKLNDPTTLTLRQDIIHIISQLKELPIIDVAGTLMQLNSISTQLDQIPVVSTPIVNDNLSKTPATTEKSWRKYWQQSLDTLKHFVVIRYQGQPIEPLISPKEQLFLEENIQLKLSQAAWGLLQKNQSVYQQSLNDAVTWIKKYYAPDSDAKNTTINSLQALMNLNVQPQLPDLTSAMTEINNLLHSTKSQAKGDNT